MRKDHLITPEEKFTKQQHIEANRRIRFEQPIDILTDDNRVCLSYIANAYLSVLRSTPSASLMISFNPSVHTTFSFLHLMEIDKFIPLKLINFLRLIPEFQSLNENDRLALVKYNFFPLFVLHDVLVYNSKNGLYYDDTGSIMDEKFAHYYTSLCLLFYGYDFHQLYSFHLTTIQNLIDNDSMIIQLLMLVLIFLKGASIYNQQRWVLFDLQTVFYAHLKYVDLLFRYLIHRYSFDRAVIQMMRLIESIFKLQEHARFYQEKIQNESNQIQIDPTMKSLISLYNYQ
jgi:hypothetical protein